MRKILFVRNEKAFLPEIDAYIKYFNNTDEFVAYDSSEIGNYDINNFDIIWEMKGFGGIRSSKHIIIHDYASLSVGSFAKSKNWIKSIINPKADLRIFLNKNVKQEFYFKNDIRYCYRDMGIDEKFIKLKSSQKEYEFVYIGAISKERNIDQLLEIFTNNQIGKLCLIGNIEDDLYKKYKYNKNFIFTGKLSYEEVPNVASKAIYGINYIPDKYPYNLQTSTKLLEYLAMDLKVITTDYQWIKEFEQKEKIKMYKLNNLINDLSINKIEKFDFISHKNMEKFLWNNIINESGVLKELKNIY